MSFLVPLLMFAWIPLVLALFAFLRPIHAVLTSFLVAWLFLPMAGYTIQGLPDYTKMSATCYGILLAAFIFDFQRLLSFRPHWLDFPMAAVCLIPILSGVSYGWGLYDGLSGSLNKMVTWGLPYLLGRLYFRSGAELRVLAVSVIIGGLVYVPLVLYEMRMSPQLHNLAYGFHQHNFAQTMRGGGWRPMVFMQHGLAVATFMWSAAMLAWIGWRSRELRHVLGVPMAAVAVGLVLISLACRSTGASVLGLAALGVYECWRLGWKFPAIGLILVPVTWALMRTVGSFSGEILVTAAETVFSESRAGSLLTRLHSEAGVWELSQNHLLFGTNRFIYAGQKTAEGWPIIADALWVIMLCCYGVVGLACWLAAQTLAPLLVLLKLRSKTWQVINPALLVATVLVVATWTIDSLLNAMLNPLFLLMLGAVTTITLKSAQSEAGCGAELWQVDSFPAPAPATEHAATV